MRRIVSALVFALLAIALVVPPAAAAAAPSPSPAAEDAGSWCRQLLSALWGAIEAAVTRPSSSSVPAGAAPQGPDTGPEMDPNG